MKKKTNSQAKKVGLFVTCLVDLFRPSVGFAAVKLLEDAGCIVEAPHKQICCGQPAYNSGDNKDSCELAANIINEFESYDAVVVPSGSCAAMIKHHYPQLFSENEEWHRRAAELSKKTFELVSFLTDELGIDKVNAKFSTSVTYHDSCSGLRELGVQEQPRKLLESVAGLELKELPSSNVCCGFGGTFCVKYSDISDRMVSDKVSDIVDTGATTVLAGDLGCLLNIAGKISRNSIDIKVRHVAEVLADMDEIPAIGESLRRQESRKKES